MASSQAGRANLSMAIDEPVILHAARAIVRVTGTDATAYLQSQLSQDVVALPVGGSTRSLLLEPSGHVVGWFRVIRDSDDEFLLETDPEPGVAEAIVTRLARFRLRMDVSFGIESWVATRTFDAAVASGDEPAVATDQLRTGAPIHTVIDWPGHGGYELLVPADGSTFPDDTDPMEWHRISAGVPRAGVDFAVDGTTIPAELGEWVIATSVCFTKGCYTGQELVARVDSRGSNVPKPLRLLRLDEMPPPGADVWADDRSAGVVTSSATAADGRAVALAVVARRVAVPSAAIVVSGSDSIPATVEALPGSSS